MAVSYLVDNKAFHVGKLLTGTKLRADGMQKLLTELDGG